MASKISKIIPRIFGGLGNQLFIYAAARRLALVNGAELALDDVSGFVRDHEYNRHYQLDHFNIPCRKATAAERLEPFARVRRYLKRKWNQRLPFEQRKYLVQESVDFDERLLTFKPRGTVYLEGYWQSEDYFKDIEPQIRADLRIHPPTDTVNQQMAERIRATNAVAVHVRFFDAPAQSALGVGGNNAPGDYYQRAIKVMQEQAPDAQYYIFSDQPQAARARIPLRDDHVTLVNHNQCDAVAYADLWLISQCQHFIIANSTFSWWGAWLGKTPESIVIAPGFEKREGAMFWGFRGLLPDRWVKL
ncbi:alpha-1,2-fucosyltransferase [Candidatus Symbiobacter mobilis]|uniref:Glycosyltransferase n=1 Tax=Candidatus Symbiobacter mobilis CR TaxID=946483 RepID=U5N5J1_9BURK|nr:alpha-1,2-fucosyltransferase [Candidatus Symbiobacter mobilis]AGX86622.1 glycosyltransferase [Candidatus Symbiobacter mobilis CR]